MRVYGGDYEKVVRKYDSKDSAFFLDPPYPGYNVDVGESEFDEERFFKLLKSLKGRFLITYGIRGKFPDLVKGSDFWSKRIRTRRSIAHMRGVGGSSVLTQLLVANYEPTTKALDDEFVLDDWDGTLDDDGADDLEKAQPFGTFGGSIGMPLEKARQELQKLRQAASFEEYAKQARKGTTRLKDAAHAAQARRAVLIDVGFDVALPAILELGGLLAEAWSENNAVEHRAKRREEVRKVIEESTKKLADRAWSLWRDEGMPSALEAALNVAKESATAAAASLPSEGQAITTTLDRLSGVLAKLEVAS